MTFVRANPPGWALFELLLSSQMNTIDSQMPFALDGQGGGTYSPTAGINLIGDAIGIGPMLSLTKTVPGALRLLELTMEDGDPGVNVARIESPAGGVASGNALTLRPFNNLFITSASGLNTQLIVLGNSNDGSGAGGPGANIFAGVTAGDNDGADGINVTGGALTGAAISRSGGVGAVVTGGSVVDAATDTPGGLGALITGGAKAGAGLGTQSAGPGAVITGGAGSNWATGSPGAIIVAGAGDQANVAGGVPGLVAVGENQPLIGGPGFGGVGVIGSGGRQDGGQGGDVGGQGALLTGGAAVGSSTGGPGADLVGGDHEGVGLAGPGATITGGENLAGIGGVGAAIRGGDGDTASDALTVVTGVHGSGFPRGIVVTHAGNGGTGIDVTGGNNSHGIITRGTLLGSGIQAIALGDGTGVWGISQGTGPAGDFDAQAGGNAIELKADFSGGGNPDGVHILFADGVAPPATPANGSLWWDGTNLRLQSGGTTFTLDKT